MPSFYLELRQLIAQDDLATAIARLQTLLHDSPKLDEAIVHSARHWDILRQVRLGTINEQQANLTKNQIRTGLLDLIRELEEYEIETTHQTDLDYRKIIEKIKVNRGAGTSELLKNKHTEDLDEKELARLFDMERVIRILNDAEHSASDLTTHQKLLELALAENGHIFKGTFLCLGKQNQIRTICHTATESKFIFFKGTDRIEILVLETLNGNLLRQFERMILLLRTHIPLGRDRARSEDVYEIPIVAVREFVANAFVHRDYGSDVQSYIQVELFDDRLEIKSPGQLPPNVDVHKIEGTVLINPVIAAIFHLYKHIERAGTGIRVAQQTLQAVGLKPARIENIDNPKMVKVTIFRNVYIPSGHKRGFWEGLLKGVQTSFS